jgi:hypothetical protein
MPPPGPPDRRPPSSPAASYGWTVLVAYGWFATVGATALVGFFLVPEPPHPDCSAIFSCLSPVQAMALWLAVALPAVVAAIVATALVAIPVSRLFRSPFLAGTLTVVCAALVVLAAVQAYRGVR